MNVNMGRLSYVILGINSLVVAKIILFVALLLEVQP